MKKFIVAILAMVYITTSTGATLHMHYCMGKLSHWDLGHNESKICSQCGMKNSEKNNKGCCDDKHKFLKNNADQKITETIFQGKQLITITVPFSFIKISLNIFKSITIEYSYSHPPPQNSGVAVYIRNCVFLI